MGVLDYMKPRPLSGSPTKVSSKQNPPKKSEPFLSKESLDLLESQLASQSYIHGSSNGMLKSQAKVSSVSLELLLHPESLSLALGLSLKGHLHGVEGLGLGLLDEDELLLLLGKTALDLLPDGVELQLAPQHLVLLLLKGGLGLLQGGLELHLLGLKALPDFVNLVDGASTLADLVHDILDLVGEGLVLPADLLQLEHGLLVGRLHLEQLRGGV